MKNQFNWIVSCFIAVLLLGVIVLTSVVYGQAKQINSLNKDILQFSAQRNETQKQLEDLNKKLAYQQMPNDQGKNRENF